MRPALAGIVKAQVALCNSARGAGHLPEKQVHVAACLNLQYYKFKD
jgi:hypothetical protein